MSTADTCRARGWRPGDLIEGPDSFGKITRLRITAIGDRVTLASERDGPRGEREDAWSISWESWKRIEREPVQKCGHPAGSDTCKRCGP